MQRFSVTLAHDTSSINTSIRSMALFWTNFVLFADVVYNQWSGRRSFLGKSKALFGSVMIFAVNSCGWKTVKLSLADWLNLLKVQGSK